MMHPSDRLGEHRPNLEDFQLLAPGEMLLLWDTIRNNHFVQSTRVDPVHGIAGEDTVCDDCIDTRGAVLLEQLGRTGNGVGCICQIVYENSATVRY